MSQSAQRVSKDSSASAVSSATSRLARQRKAFVPVHPTPCGKYTLIAKVGHGGMAEVFLAVTTGMGGFKKLSVVKRIHPQLLEEPEFVDMFLDEARLAARLSHPNVVQTHEVGDHEGVPFIAMEFMEGQPYDKVLKALRRQGDDVPLKFACRVAMEALAGLHYAHQLKDYDGSSLGVVHRDISPSNIFVTYQGAVKILDFGIAKATTKLSETRTGQIKGKLSYMAPEQARGRTVDGRADVWSVGVTLVESCTGARLFKGESDVDTLQRVLTGDVQEMLSEANLPEPLMAVVRKSLARKLEDRYESAAAMRSALEKILPELPGPDPDVAEYLEAHFGELATSQREMLGDLLSQVDRLIEEEASQASKPAKEMEPRPSLSPASVRPPATEPGNENAGRLQLALLLVLVIMGVAGGAYVALSSSQTHTTTTVIREVQAAPAPAPVPAEQGGAAGSGGEAVQPRPEAQQQDGTETTEIEVDDEPRETEAPRRPTGRRTTGRGGRHPAPAPEPAPAPAPAAEPAPSVTETGTLRLVTRPYSEVYLGGRRIGTTPMLGEELPVGSHTLVLRNPEQGLEQRITVRIQPNETTRLNIALQ